MDKDTKKFLLDMNIEGGGSWFYELSILVCSGNENQPILDYTNLVWGLDCIDGPYNKKTGDKINIDADLTLSGILNIEGLLIPFITMNINEGNAGANWLDICFYEHSLKYVLGIDYSAEADITNHPEKLVNFFEYLLPKLYTIFNFNIAIVGVEVSGMYDLEYFEDVVQDNARINNQLFYVGKKEYNKIAEKNKKYFKIIN